MVQAGILIAFFAASALYAAPSVIAVLRSHRRWALIVAVNILLGWSIVGWLLALMWALGIVPRRPAWTRWARKPRPEATAPRKPGGEAAANRDPDDPPAVREDVYESWLDEGAAIPGSTQRTGSL